MRALYFVVYKMITRSARIIMNMILTIQRHTIERKIGCDVAKSLITNLNYFFIIFNI